MSWPARHASVAALSAEFVPGDADLSLLTEPAELSLMRKLSEFSEIVEGAATDLAPYRLTRYRRRARGGVPPVLHGVPRDD